MQKEWNLKLRHTENGHQVAIPAELAHRQGIVSGDEIMVWCDGDGVNAKNGTGQTMPEYPRDHPTDQKVFVKRVHKSGTTLVLTLPAKIVGFMELEGQKNVTVRDMEDHVRVEPTDELPDPAFVAGVPRIAPGQASGKTQKNASAGCVAPFVAHSHQICRIAKTLRLEDLLDIHDSSEEGESGSPSEGGSPSPLPSSSETGSGTDLSSESPK